MLRYWKHIMRTASPASSPSMSASKKVSLHTLISPNTCTTHPPTGMMEVKSLFNNDAHREDAGLPRSPAQSPSSSSPYARSDLDSSDSSPSSQCLTYKDIPLDIMNSNISTLKAMAQSDFSDEKAIVALPLRGRKAQRPHAIQLAKVLYPWMTDIAAIIHYENLTVLARSIVRDRQKARDFARLQLQPKSTTELLRVQGPWAGQHIDPLDLRGPAATPMPVTIGKTEDFAPIFGFLAENEPFAAAGNSNPGFELLRSNEQFTGDVPMLEFNRGIIYEDGRLDLCKKVVGPTHIGKLMKSLESNDHVRHFLLGNNAISTTGAKCISEFIQKYPSRMETWYLAGCHITHHGLSLLVSQMMASSTLTNLWFKRNPFGPNSAGSLAELILRTLNLRTLDLETTELGDEGTSRFIDLITGQPAALRHLYLNANGIGEKACVSLGKYLSHSNCALESLFLSTNPIGDAGMLQLAPGLAESKTLKRLTCASAGLTGKGLSCLASAIHGGGSLQSLDIGASSTTGAHSQKFNYFDDSCVDALKSLLLLPSMRWLNLGRTVFSASGLDEIRSAAAQSQLVFIDLQRVEIAGFNGIAPGKPNFYDAIPVRSCHLDLRNQLAKNQAKYYPRYANYKDFLSSDDLRFLRNTSDVRKIDSMYRTQDKRLGLPMGLAWEKDDPVWNLIVEDARMADEASSS